MKMECYVILLYSTVSTVLSTETMRQSFLLRYFFFLAVVRWSQSTFPPGVKTAAPLCPFRLFSWTFCLSDGQGCVPSPPSLPPHFVVLRVNLDTAKKKKTRIKCELSFCWADVAFTYIIKIDYCSLETCQHIRCKFVSFVLSASLHSRLQSDRCEPLFSSKKKQKKETLQCLFWGHFQNPERLSSCQR